MFHQTKPSRLTFHENRCWQFTAHENTLYYPLWNIGYVYFCQSSADERNWWHFFTFLSQTGDKSGDDCVVYYLVQISIHHRIFPRIIYWNACVFLALNWFILNSFRLSNYTSCDTSLALGWPLLGWLGLVWSILG